MAAPDLTRRLHDAGGQYAPPVQRLAHRRGHEAGAGGHFLRSRLRADEALDRGAGRRRGGSRGLLDSCRRRRSATRLKAPQAGYIHHMDAQKIGESSAILGAGRKTKDDVIDPAAGIVLKEKTGDEGGAGP